MSKKALFVTAAVFMMGLTFAVPPAVAGGGCHGPTTEARGTAVEIVDRCFTPTNIYVQPGDEVTWVNRDSLTHVVAGNGGEWGHFEEMRQGDRIAFRFDRPGVYAYTCYLHPGMNGTVIVGKVKTPSATVEAVGAAAPSSVSEPPTGPPAAKPVAEPRSATVASTSDSRATRALGFIGLGLVIGAGGTLAAQRMTARRSQAAISAG
jgi:plastocyanin